MRLLADYTNCRSWEVLRVPRQLFVRLEEVNQLEGLGEDVSCYQDQSLQRICGFFECHSGGGGWGHDCVGVYGEPSSTSYKCGRQCLPRCCSVLLSKLRTRPGRVIMNARSGRVSKTCSSSKFRIAHCREYKERLELNVRMWYTIVLPDL